MVAKPTDGRHSRPFAFVRWRNEQLEPRIFAMNADRTVEARARTELLEADLVKAVVGVFYDVYNEVGIGFLESVYRRAMATALRDAGIDAAQEAPIEVVFRGRVVGFFRADLIVGARVAVEIKVARAIEPIHVAQVINYLRASTLEVGLLLNFGPKPEFRRLIMSNTRKHSR